MKRDGMSRVDAYGYRPECGKYGHPTKASAREHAKKMRRVGEHLRAYLCQTCGLYHVGHLPQAVMSGRISSDDYYA